MGKPHNDSNVASEMLSQLGGCYSVLLRYARDGKLYATEFFGCLEAGEPKIRNIVLDPTVEGVWVGAQNAQVSALQQLLQELNADRAFDCISSSGSHGKVYDLL